MKKSLLIIYPQLQKASTGGQVIDFEFITQLKESDMFNMSYIQDKDISTTTNISYILYFFKNFRRFLKYNVIFMNSRNYPRLLLFVWGLRICGYKGKLLAYHHHYNFETNKGLLRLVHRFLELSFLKSLTNIIIPSPFVLDLTKKLLPHSSTIYIPIGFKTNKIVRTSNDYDGSEKRLLYVGSIDRRKRCHQMVQIAKELKAEFKKLVVDIVGGILENDYYNEIIKIIEDNQLENNVIVHGRVDDEKLNYLYSKADLFVFPSSYEGYGMVLIEAMSYGLPVVAYNNSAMPYSIKNGYNGFLVDDNDVSALIDKIGMLLNDCKIRKSMSDNAERYVSELPSIIDMQHEMNNFIKTL